jgi:hypothetical protein
VLTSLGCALFVLLQSGGNCRVGHRVGLYSEKRLGAGSVWTPLSAWLVIFSCALMLVSPWALQRSESFLECFRKNLCDIGIDPRPYGTHSFRRGGCQYLAMVLRWPFRNICTWGGWAENFDNPGTIFKYLLSWTDTPLLDREDYFNPNRASSDLCTACGRTCWCA